MGEHANEIELARTLIRKGDHAHARVILLQAIKRDADQAIESMTELAWLARKEGNQNESDEWISKAESELRPDDLNGHLALNSAYSLGLGPGTLEDHQKKAIDHLTQVALGDNTYAQETLALYFLHGLNGCPKDIDRFERWIQSALALGSKRAAYIYSEYLFRARKPIPQTLLETLELQRHENEASKRLLNSIARRGRSRKK